MKAVLIKLRNFLIRFFYKQILKRILFRIDPEKTHDTALKIGKFCGSHRLTKSLAAFAFSYSNSKLEQNILGINFKNPVGLAAGFDKDAEMIDIMPHLGFGFTEIGSITGEKCKGNPPPRLWRLIKSQGLVVYYGLKNKGCEEIGKMLRSKKFFLPVGINIAKTNCKRTVKLEKGIKDYVKAFNELNDIGDYITINISCPNAFGGKPFTNANNLEKLLTAIENSPIKSAIQRPIFLKIAPDLTIKQINQIIKIAEHHRIDGFICTNLTKDKHNKKMKKFIKDENVPKVGGISGKPVEELSNRVIKYIYKKTKGKYVIIGCGGIFSAKDAYKKIKLGASLVQLITGMIFEGPQIISEINQGLVELLEKDGFFTIKEAIGADNSI